MLVDVLAHPRIHKENVYTMCSVTHMVVSMAVELAGYEGQGTGLQGKGGVELSKDRRDPKQHAATVIRPGHTFVQRLIKLLLVFQSKEQWIRLSSITRSDLCWWSSFMEGWNGISLMFNGAPLSTPLVSDASGSWGYGAFWGTRWFQWKWQGLSRD